MLAQQSNTQQERDIIAPCFDTCFVAAADYKQRDRERKKKKEKKINSRRDIWSDLMVSGVL